MLKLIVFVIRGGDVNIIGGLTKVVVLARVVRAWLQRDSGGSNTSIEVALEWNTVLEVLV